MRGNIPVLESDKERVEGSTVDPMFKNSISRLVVLALLCGYAILPLACGDPENKSPEAAIKQKCDGKAVTKDSELNPANKVYVFEKFEGWVKYWHSQKGGEPNEMAFSLKNTCDCDMQARLTSAEPNSTPMYLDEFLKKGQTKTIQGKKPSSLEIWCSSLANKECTGTYQLWLP